MITYCVGFLGSEVVTAGVVDTTGVVDATCVVADTKWVVAFLIPSVEVEYWTFCSALVPLSDFSWISLNDVCNKAKDYS